MPSRQDQLHSAQFATQRVVSALVTHDPDPAQSPFRIATAAAAVGLIVSLLIAGGFAVYGSYTHDKGKDAWRVATAVFIETDSGANYVYLDTDQKLHPVTNYASGLLIAKGPNPRPVTMSAKALSVAPRGARLGIVDAPDSLPARADLLTGPWAVCSRLDGTTRDPTSTLILGGTSGGRVVAAAGGASPEALLAMAPDGHEYLISGNHRFSLPEPRLALAALGMTSQPIRVSAALINALPAGADVRPPAIPDRGQVSKSLPTARVGQLYTATAPGGARVYGVVMADGIAEVTEVLANLLAAEPRQGTSGSQQPTQLGIDAYAALPRSSAKTFSGQDGTAALPKTTPKPVTANQSVCVSVQNPTDSGTRVVVDAALPDDVHITDTPGATTTGTVLADQIAVKRGHGVVVEAAASPTATSGALSLVTDAGIRYPIANRDVLPILGYANIKPARIPAQLVAMLPTGPSLDPDAARRPA